MRLSDSLSWPQNTAAIVLLLAAAADFSLAASPAPPSFSPAGGFVRSPASVTATHPNTAGTIFYTIDGPDPRDAFGGVDREARSLLAPLSVNRSMVIRARVQRGDEWSELVAAGYTADQDFSKLFFTELMYHPRDADDLAEFIELKNTGAVALDLSGLRLRMLNSANAFTFPNGKLIGPGEFVVLIHNVAGFRGIHPTAPYDGIYSGTLDNSSVEDVRLERNGASAARALYETAAPWQVAPDNHGYFAGDGVGFSLVRTTFDPNSDLMDYRPWRASTYRFGSPGADDPQPIVPPIYINELLTRGGTGVLDSIEFFNPNATPVDLGGWWLSDERNFPYRYKIPAGTVVPALGYLVLDESQYGSGVGFSADGERCYLFSGDADGNLTGYSHGFEFAAGERDISLGRHVASDGTEDFPQQTIRTPGSTNAAPRISPVVISEIMHRPAMLQGEYIELHNPNDSAFNLWDPDNPASTWAIGLHRYLLTPFPPGVTISARGYLLVVQGDPAVIRVNYAVPAGVPILRIANAFTFFPQEVDVFLFKPVGVSRGSTRYATVEHVKPAMRAPWAPGADSAGHSLERIALGAYPNDPSNWRDSPTINSPGRPNSENMVPSVFTGGDQTLFTAREGTLTGAVVDDHWAGSTVTSVWSQVNGPAAVDMSNATLTSVTVRFPAPGQYIMRLTASDETQSASDTATINVIDRPFDAWRSANFTAAELANDLVSHPGADPDGDGLRNEGEYLFARPPKASGVSNPLGLSISNGQLQATWLQRSNSPDMVIIPERADRLDGPWFSGWEFFERIEAPDADDTNVTAREKFALSGRTQSFIRLRYRLR